MKTILLASALAIIAGAASAETRADLNVRLNCGSPASQSCAIRVLNALAAAGIAIPADIEDLETPIVGEGYTTEHTDGYDLEGWASVEHTAGFDEGE